MQVGAENRHLRQAANRYVQAPKKPLTDNESPNRPI